MDWGPLQESQMTSRRQIEEKDDAENYRVGGIAQHDAGAEKGERS